MGRNKKQHIKTIGHSQIAQQLQIELDKSIVGFRDLESRVYSKKDGGMYRDYKYELCCLIWDSWKGVSRKHKADDKYFSYGWRDLQDRFGRDYRKIMSIAFIHKVSGGGYKAVRDGVTYKYKLKDDVIDIVNQVTATAFERKDYIKDGEVMTTHTLPKYAVREKKNGKWVTAIKVKDFPITITLNGDNIKLLLSIYSDLQKYYKDNRKEIDIKDGLEVLKDFGWDIDTYKGNRKKIIEAVDRRLYDIINLITLTHNNAYNTDDILQVYTIKDSGRFYIAQDKNDTDTNLQNLPREIRKIVMGGLGYWEYDIENAHYNIVNQLYKGYTNKKLKYIDYYCNNTKEIRERVQTDLGVSYKLSKELLLMLIYGANIFDEYKYDNKLKKRVYTDVVYKLRDFTGGDEKLAGDIQHLICKNVDLINIRDDLRKSQKIILENSRVINVRGIEKMYNLNNRLTTTYNKAYKKTKGQLLAHVIQGVESEILLAVHNEDDGMIMFHHDGWVSKTNVDVNRLQQIINAKLTQLMIENKIDGDMRFTVTKEELTDVNKTLAIIKRISLGEKITLKV